MNEREERLSDEEERILAHAEERFDAASTPEEVDEEQLRQGRLVEKEKDWVDPREVVGGED